MERLGLMELFDAAVFDEDIEHHKPCLLYTSVALATSVRAGMPSMGFKI